MNRILFIGATGMVGRPIARALAADARFEVAALVRNPDRARPMLPPSIRLIRGDVRDPQSLDTALAGTDSVYCNFNTPFSRRTAFDPDRDGTALVLAAARRAGIRRFARTSALGAPEARHDWWAIGRKTLTDEAVVASGIPFTIFRPTWLMECLPLCKLGPCIMQLFFERRRGGVPIWWIAGEDFGRMVAAALATPAGENQTIPCQGPEAVELADAARRFARALSPPKPLLPVLGASMRLGGLLSSTPRYFVDLVDMTRKHTPALVGEGAWSAYSKPAVTLEAYAASIARTGDWPRK